MERGMLKTNCIYLPWLYKWPTKLSHLWSLISLVDELKMRLSEDYSMKKYPNPSQKLLLSWIYQKTEQWTMELASYKVLTVLLVCKQAPIKSSPQSGTYNNYKVSQSCVGILILRQTFWCQNCFPKSLPINVHLMTIRIRQQYFLGWNRTKTDKKQNWNTQNHTL